MKPISVKDNFDSIEDEHLFAVDRTVGVQMYELAEKLKDVNLGEIINECHKAAIDATMQTKPELAAIFIRLGAELLRTKRVWNCSKRCNSPLKGNQTDCCNGSRRKEILMNKAKSTPDAVEQSQFEAEIRERAEALLNRALEFAVEISANKYEALNDEGMAREMLSIVAAMEMMPTMTRDDLADVIIGFAGQLLYRIGLTEVTLQ